MPFPGWVASFNRRYTNRLMMPLTNRPPFARLRHLGRSTGRLYEIPINAFPLEGGFVIALTYGAGTDWVRNVFAAGSAEMDYRNQTIRLTNPGLIDRAVARPAIGWLPRVFLALLRVDEYLRLDIENQELPSAGKWGAPTKRR